MDSRADSLESSICLCSIHSRRYSEDTIAEDALPAPDYPPPPDLPSYNDASRETTQTAMTMSWLGH